jgi:hypothetical protein
MSELMLFYAEGEDSMFLQKVGIHLLHYVDS